MANIFDQFDAAPPNTMASPPNIFDQFDAPAAAPTDQALSYSDRWNQAKAIPGQLAEAGDAAARAISSGVPFSNRIVATEKSLPIVGNGQSYSENLAQEDAARAQLAQTHPMANALGQGVGGLVSTLAVPGAIPAEGSGLLGSLWAATKAGMGYGAAQGVSDQPDLTNPVNDISGAATGALKGGALGFGLGGLGYGAGKTGSALLDWLNGAPGAWSGEGRALGALADASTTDANTRRLLFNTSAANRPPQDFGPQTMPLDTGPAMRQLAQKVASTPEGAPLKAAVIDRANNVDQSISQALLGIIGPDQSALAAALEMKDTKAMESAALPPIFARAPPVDVSPVVNQIDQMQARLPAGTPEQLALARAQRMLIDTPAQTAQPGVPATRTPVFGPQGQVIRYDTTPGTPGTAGTPTQLVTDAQTLHAAKQSIDNLINFGDPTIGVTPGALASKDGALSQVRGGINQALRGQVPGYGGTMDELASINRQIEALQYGQGLLNTGKTAIHPEISDVHINALPNNEASVLQSGVNSEIYRMAGTPANKTGLDTLNAILPNEAQTGDNWNGQKLAQIYSPEQVGALTDLRNQGNQFRDVAGQIGAQPVAAPRPPLTPTDAGWIAYDAARGPHGLPLLAANTLNAIGRMMPGTTAKNSALAEALASKGIDKDSIAAAIGDLLSRRAAGQNAGTTFAPIFAGLGLGAFDR
jgi:hypothetical protein